jgi:hypothetical protein
LNKNLLRNKKKKKRKIWGNRHMRRIVLKRRPSAVASNFFSLLSSQCPSALQPGRNFKSLALGLPAALGIKEKKNNM